MRKFLASWVIGISFLVFQLWNSNSLVQKSILFRRVQTPDTDSALVLKVQQVLSSILSDEKIGQDSLQYGRTLGDEELQTQVAKILTSLGINVASENVAMFDDFSELYIILGQIFINQSDKVLYQEEKDDLTLLEYYGADLKQLSSSCFNHNNGGFDGVKLIYISDSSKLDTVFKEELLKAADEYNFLIVEKGQGAGSSKNSLKSMDINGRVIFTNDFNQIIPGISSLNPLIYVEASDEIMEKINLAKGGITLCTNSLLQKILIELIGEKISDENIELRPDKTNISENDFNSLFSQTGQRLMPSAIREILRYAKIKGLIYLAGGLPAPEAFPLNELKEIISEITLSQWQEIENYSSNLGLSRLRSAVAEWLNKRIFKEDIASDGNILVTNGSQQALDILGRWASEEDRKIITESPTYLGVLTAVLPHVGEDGVEHMDLRTKEGLNELKTYIQFLKDNGESAPIIYVTPTFGNPAGDLWTLKERQNLIQIVQNFRNDGYDIVIIEDDPYGELNYTGEGGGERQEITRMKTLAPDAVVYMTSNSKVFSPGLRIGYIAASDEYTEKFSRIMQALDVGVPALAQFVVARFIETGMLDKHIDDILSIYYNKAAAMDSALREYMPDGVEWVKPEGGLFVWVTVPQEWGLDMDFLLKNVAVKTGVNIDGENVKFAYVPGGVFSLDGSTDNCVRLCFSTASVEQIEKAIHALAEMVKEYRE